MKHLLKIVGGEVLLSHGSQPDTETCHVPKQKLRAYLETFSPPDIEQQILCNPSNYVHRVPATVPSKIPSTQILADMVMY